MTDSKGEAGPPGSRPRTVAGLIAALQELEAMEAAGDDIGRMRAAPRLIEAAKQALSAERGAALARMVGQGRTVTSVAAELPGHRSALDRLLAQHKKAGGKR